jgi:hypothetical protein
LWTFSGSIALIVSWSEVYFPCIECNFQNALMLGVVVVESIYSPQPPNGRWGWLLSMGAPDSPVLHRTLSAAPPRHPTVRVWEQSTVGAVVFLWHRTVRCRTGQLLFIVRCALTLTCTVAHCSACQVPLQSTVVLKSRCSAGAPDSPVAYQTVW